MENSKFKTEYKLKQHTMLLHFQAKPSSGENVCLRASEVKPKLDRFILKKLGEIKTVKEKYSSWIQAEHQNGEDVAFKYRMTIVRCSERMNIYETDHRTRRDRENGVPGPNFVLPNIYYGNMGDGPEKYGVFFIDGLKIKITCFIPDLTECINKNIAEFFAVTNFGTMQNKGFGSFTIEGTDDNTVIEALKANYESNKCFKITVDQRGFDNDAQKELFDTVKQVYSVMKSGQNIMKKGKLVTNCDKYIRSFIYEYMHDEYKVNGERVNIGNEKAYLKKKGVAPIRTTHEPKNEHECDKQSDIDNNDFRFVRSLLGIAENIEWNEPEDEQASDKLRKEKISISDITYSDEKDKNIARCPSPIFLKIIGSNIYFTANNPNEKTFERKFEFTNNGYTKRNAKKSTRYNKSGTLSTLDKNEGKSFDIADFLTRYKDYYNKNIKKLKIKFQIKEV